jgi:hypothetical protein
MKRMALALLAALALPTPALAQDEMTGALPGLEHAPPFQADVVITSAGNPTPTAWHIAYMAQRVRLTSRAQGGQTIITRLDQGTVYMSQGGNQWMQLSLAAVGATGLMAGNFNHTMRKTGHAMLDGKDCDVYQTRSGDGSTSTVNYVYHDFPVRSIVTGPAGKTTVEYRNLQTGGVSDSLFELPANAEVMSMEGILNQAKGAASQQQLEQQLQQMGN